MSDYGIGVDEPVIMLTDYGVGVCREYEMGSGDFLSYRISCPSCAKSFEEVYFGCPEQAVDYFNLHKEDCYFDDDMEPYGLGNWLDEVKNS